MLESELELALESIKSERKIWIRMSELKKLKLEQYSGLRVEKKINMSSELGVGVVKNKTSELWVQVGRERITSLY